MALTGTRFFALLKGLLVVAVAAGAGDLSTFPQRIWLLELFNGFKLVQRNLHRPHAPDEALML